ncbi:MAG: hypothetical protein LBS90_08320 [Oscillospiraceae bacterium]|jgi:S-formylglutathione hydrolase FrmB|nr:hypothetical protein [Oscillospiraceae bacterium]
MAWLQINHKSNALHGNVTLNVVIPAEPPMFPRQRADFKTVYLLHGITGDNTDWLLNTDAAALAQAADTCFVFISGGNGYYIDSAAGGAYSEYVGREVVEFTRRLLPLSPKRGDTTLAGYSMGGYGALYNGLKHFETFGHIIALSAADGISNAVASGDAPNQYGFTRAFYRALYGSDEAIAALPQSEYFVANLAARVLPEAKAKGLPLDLYFACGWNDFLAPVNRELKSRFDATGFPHFYEEGPGGHEWAFWQKFLRRGLERIAPIPQFGMKGTPFWLSDPRDAE